MRPAVTMRRVPVIKPEYGPTLGQLLARRSLAVRVAAAALALAVVLGAALVAITSRAGETEVLIRSPVTFNFVHGSQWQRVERPGALVALRNIGREGRVKGLFLDAYAVRDLRLPAYRGAAGGMLPIYANRYVRAIRGRYSDFEQVAEGRARINNAIGYEVTFRARLGTRRLYGRHTCSSRRSPTAAAAASSSNSSPRPGRARRARPRSATTAR